MARTKSGETLTSARFPSRLKGTRYAFRSKSRHFGFDIGMRIPGRVQFRLLPPVSAVDLWFAISSPLSGHWEMLQRRKPFEMTRRLLMELQVAVGAGQSHCVKVNVHAEQ